MLNKAIKLLYIICLSSLLASPIMAERQIGKFKGNTYLYCEASENQVFSRKLSETGEILKEKKIKKSKAKKFIKRYKKTLQRLNTDLEAKNLSEQKTSILEEQKERFKILVKNLKKCISGNKKKDQNFDPIPVDPNDTNQEGEEFNTTSASIGTIQANCLVFGQNIAATNDIGIAEPILAPISGSIKCTLENNVETDIIVKVFANNSNADPELLLSQKITKEEIGNDKLFAFPICKEKPACFKSKKVNAAINTVGINIELSPIS